MIFSKVKKHPVLLAAGVGNVDRVETCTESKVAHLPLINVTVIEGLPTPRSHHDICPARQAVDRRYQSNVVPLTIRL
ncbi:hypothetical protein [Streptomyces sp. NPDC057909]|uniref:hypothetical protein n=1 Tax=Streptomyces sp. NPDC057909 TaxID=3346277 RepID=UPI0036E167A6